MVPDVKTISARASGSISGRGSGSTLRAMSTSDSIASAGSSSRLAAFRVGSDARTSLARVWAASFMASSSVVRTSAGTTTAPAHSRPRNEMPHSGRLTAHTRTRSPGSTPGGAERARHSRDELTDVGVAPDPRPEARLDDQRRQVAVLRDRLVHQLDDRVHSGTASAIADSVHPPVYGKTADNASPALVHDAGPAYRERDIARSAARAHGADRDRAPTGASAGRRRPPPRHARAAGHLPVARGSRQRAAQRIGDAGAGHDPDKLRLQRRLCDPESAAGRQLGDSLGRGGLGGAGAQCRHRNRRNLDRPVDVAGRDLAGDLRRGDPGK